MMPASIVKALDDDQDEIVELSLQQIQRLEQRQPPRAQAAIQQIGESHFW